MKYKKQMVTAGIIVALVVGVQLLRHGSSLETRPVSGAEDPKSQGRPGAPVHIVEYSDFQCPACAAAHSLLKTYAAENPDKVYIQYRNYPLPTMHPQALKLAVYAECAARQKRFLAVHDAFFESQKKLWETSPIDGVVEAIASDAGLDLEALKACAADSRTVDGVLSEKGEGLAKGVQATPSFFINGKLTIGVKGLKKALGIQDGSDPL